MRNWKTWLSPAIQPSSHKGCVTLPFNFPQWWDLSCSPPLHWRSAPLIFWLPSAFSVPYCSFTFALYFSSSCSFLSVTDEAENVAPQLGTAEIKVPSVKKPRGVIGFPAWQLKVGQKYSLACFTYCFRNSAFWGFDFAVHSTVFIPSHLPVWSGCVWEREDENPFFCLFSFFFVWWLAAGVLFGVLRFPPWHDLCGSFHCIYSQSSSCGEWCVRKRGKDFLCVCLMTCSDRSFAWWLAFPPGMTCMVSLHCIYS